MVCTSWLKSLFIFQLLGVCHCMWTRESQKALVAKFYGQLRLIRSVLRASKLSVFKTEWNRKLVGISYHPFWHQFIFGTFWTSLFNFLNYFDDLLRMTNEGSVLDISILLIKSDSNGVYILVKVSFHIRK